MYVHNTLSKNRKICIIPYLFKKKKQDVFMSLSGILKDLENKLYKVYWEVELEEVSGNINFNTHSHPIIWKNDAKANKK